MTCRLIFSCVLTALLLAGCASSEHDDLKEWMREQAKGMKGKVQPLPEITAFPAVAYEGEKLIPPFAAAKILTTDSANDKSAPDRDRARQPLGRVDRLQPRASVKISERLRPSLTMD